MLVEPTRTPYDLQFSLLGIPVRVHPFFWLTALILGSGGIIPGLQPMAQMLMWIAVVFVSIVVHEMGHALAIRFYGWRPWITLYAFGGLAAYDRSYNASFSSYRRKGDTTAAQIIISFAGPAAGFLLAALVVAAMYVANREIDFPIFRWEITFGRGASPITDSIWLFLLIWQVLAVNIYWGLINLLPVYPLDGGKISRELFMSLSPRDGYQQSLMVSIFVGGGLALYGAYREDWWLAILFGLLAYQSYQLLQHQRGGWGGKPW